MRVNHFFCDIRDDKYTRAVVLTVFLFFALGILSGLFAAGHLSTAQKEGLNTYIDAYAKSCTQEQRPAALLFSAWSVYFRYPLIFFLLGWCVLSTFLVPMLCFVQGFCLSFAITSFVSVMGSSGIYLALSVFGMRCLITLPCSFWLALWALSNSTKVSQKYRRQRTKQKIPRMLGCIPVILLIGSLAEISIVPKMINAAITKFL